MIVLEGQGVTLADVIRVARDGAVVTLGPTARERMRKARETVDRLARSDEAVYGLTTALGANTGRAIPPGELAAYQERAIRARAVGVGARLATDAVRAMMFARLAGMAVGGSGISPAVFDTLLAMLNAAVHPVVPGKGSIGVADLAPLSHMALPLLAEGSAEYRGEILPAAEALSRAGLAPVAFAAKDGLALISSNAASVGCAALALHDAIAALDALNVAAALAFEAFRANLSPLDPRVQAARPAPGQREVAARLTALLEGSALWSRGAARRVQDPVSFRCVTQVHGAVFAAAWSAREQIELELNSAADSPLVLPESGEMLSNGNFHVPGLALAFDAFGIGLAQAAAASVERCLKLFSPAFSDLPLQLTRHGPMHSGFATVQKTLTALYNEIRHAANPASLDFLPVSEAVEDHAPMTPHAIAKSVVIADNLCYLAAIELLTAAQAIDLRGLDPDTLGRGAKAAYDAVRKAVPTLDVDRPIGPDIEAIERLVAAGAIGNEGIGLR
ncbi:MAG: histidine ammonia-lyase [Betaproteobacteria bacterium]|nr:MAG: histidine ammonia-lyase [Betaproteobacteria bacterium]